MAKIISEFEKNRLAALGQRTAEALRGRHFDAYYVDSAEEACELALSLIPAEHTVGWGGSVTLGELGLLTQVKARNKCIDRDSFAPEKRGEAMRRALVADSFLMSANAISADGVIVNIDGNGNRAAAMVYGPRQTVVIAGVNKITPNLDGALLRARNVAAPTNAQRFAQLDTPCKLSGKCEDCKSADSICTNVVITRLCRPAGRVKVIIVGEKLGF